MFESVTCSFFSVLLTEKPKLVHSDELLERSSRVLSRDNVVVSV